MNNLPNLNPFRTIRKKGEKWEDHIEYYEDYTGQATDSVIFLVESYGMPDEEWEKMTKFLEAVVSYDSMRFNWTYRDQAVTDYDDNCAYVDPVYGEVDYIHGDGEITGRRQFENGDLTFDDVSDMYVNNSTKALPSWLEPTDGWEERSCDFADGWYGRNDDPEQILKQLEDKDLDVVFQISYVQPFETGFCVWTKERSCMD